MTFQEGTRTLGSDDTVSFMYCVFSLSCGSVVAAKNLSVSAVPPVGEAGSMDTMRALQAAQQEERAQPGG